MSKKIAKTGKKTTPVKINKDVKGKMNSNKKSSITTALKKAAVKKAVVKKAIVKKVAVKKAAIKKAVVKKAIVKKVAVKKAAIKKESVLKKIIEGNSGNKKPVTKKSNESKKKDIEKTVKKVIAKSKAGLKSLGKTVRVELIKKPVIKNTNDKEVLPVKLKKYKPNKKVKFNSTELKQFRKIILLERKAILESAKANMDSLVDKDSGEYKGDNLTYSSHMAEQGTDEMEREKNYLFVQRDEKYLGYLQDALMRIDQGTYGICVDCKDESKNLCKTCPLIDRERLELVPITQHCIECKNLRG
ncbi:MAG: conjugal transfer protein TraR [Ignavibacteria bacterium]